MRQRNYGGKCDEAEGKDEGMVSTIMMNTITMVGATTRKWTASKVPGTSWSGRTKGVYEILDELFLSM